MSLSRESAPVTFNDEPRDCGGLDVRSSPLLTDLYQLNMMQAYLEHGLTDAAVFELFFRRLPENRNFLMAAGLRQVVDFLSGLRFGADELQWIKDSGRFSADFADYLANLRFTGDVDAVAEGTLFFADEPVVRIVASVAQAQLVETRVINAIHFQSVIASKAARMVLAAKGRTLIDFGLRLDSGDLDALAREVRRILDAGGLADVQVFASGGIDERAIARFVDGGAPIDGFGVGTSLVTSQDSPALDCAYKLQEYAGLARRKHSAGKATWPGRKQVCRRHDSGGRMAGDTLTVLDDPCEGTPLLVPAMRDGKPVLSLPDVETARRHARAALESLSEAQRSFQPAPYPVTVSPALRDLAADVDRRLAHG